MTKRLTTLLYTFANFILLSISIPIHAGENANDDGYDAINHYAKMAADFAERVPQEKVYLHFDNTGYYRGDNIWFKAYIVNPNGNIPTKLSSTLYVELLNPGGEIIDRKVLRIKDGQAHGDFILNRIPFYSGFYEVRAYTKYMRNFDDGIVFSRIFPVFDLPKIEGDFTSKEMAKYGRGKFVYTRPKPGTENKLNLKFFPEGGNLVQGLESNVAFEATDKYGHPLDISGIITDENSDTLAQLTTAHEGKGSFRFTPIRGETKAIVMYNGKKHEFRLPDPLDSGYVMSVDNLAAPDNLIVRIDRNFGTHRDTVGIAIINYGMLRNSYIVASEFKKPAVIKIDKKLLSPGISQVVLFDKTGDAICDRLIFNHDVIPNLDVKTEFDKEQYEPYEPVSLAINIRQQDGSPVSSPFSLSVRDSEDEVQYNHNILTDLMLMSEIKGYVSNPMYYFESSDSTHRANMDLLLMVQGWRRYPWKMLTQSETFTPAYKVESNGIDVAGRVTTLTKNKPKPDVEVSAFLLHRNENKTTNAGQFDIFTTDSLGRFFFTADVEGEWNMILSVKEKGKKKDYLISIDRKFSPKPKPYRYTDMEISTIRDIGSIRNDHVTDSIGNSENDESINDILKAIDDTLVSSGVRKEHIEHLGEVVVKGKKHSREQDIYKARSKSIAYYDVKSGLDDIRDEGEYIGDDIHKFLMSMNRNFSRTISNGKEYLLYKGRMPLFVINYTPTYRTEMDYDKYKYIRLEAIKSIYISEDPNQMLKYADPLITIIDIDKIYGCAVFVETYPEGEIPVEAGKGVRKTRLDGYNTPSEFYSPDYSILEPEPDYRRTLYWNPNVIPDSDGNALVHFYNNSRCVHPKIDLQTVTPSGALY
ncbi:MAG: hypothetical protein K2G33_05590 [Duncaniella sp.]|nr:hypothetical protein [Duncaniella sp.]